MALFNTKDPALLKELNEAWLRKYTKKVPLYNPLDILKTDSDTEFEKKLTWLLTNTEYISFVCKHIFGIDLLPFQDVLLNELWNRKYPMFIGTRGVGKTFLLALYALLRASLIPGRKIIVAGASFRQSKFLHEYMEGIWRNAPVFRDLCSQESGPHAAPDVCRFRVNDSLIQCLPIGDGCVSPLTSTTYVDRFGVIGDAQLNLTGVWGNSKFRKVDYFIDNGVKPTKIVTTSNGYSFEATYNHAMKNIVGKWLRVDQMMVGDQLLIDNSIRWHNSDTDLSLPECYEIGYRCEPLSGKILSSNKKKVAKCIRGIFDRCGELGDEIVLRIDNETLIKQVQFILLHYGITSKIDNGLILYENESGTLDEILNLTLPDGYKIKSNNYDYIISIEDSECYTCDIHVPDGNEYCANGFFSHNSKIRGYRAHDLIVDEFACISRNSFLQTDLGLIKLSDYLDGAPYSLMNKDGNFEYPDTIYRTPMVDVYRVKTMYGYHIDCSSIHQVLTNSGWKKCVDLTKGDYISLGKNEYFPKNYISKNCVTLNEDIGWLLGLLVSEGTVTNRNFISFNNTDKRLIDCTKSRIPLDWIERHKPAYKDNRGWDCKESWSLTYSSVEYRSMLKDFGLDYNISLDKTVPSDILKSPRDVVIAFLSGLYEGDGTAFNCKEEFSTVLYSSSKELIEVVQLLLLKFDILSSIQERTTQLSDNTNYMLVARGSNGITLFNLLDVIKWKDIVPAPSNFKPRKPNIRKNGSRFVVATSICNKNKHIGTFDTEEECVEAFDKFWADKTEFIRVESVTKLPEQEVLYDFHMPQTHSFIGNGFTQHNSHNPQIFETVLTGFGNVAANTIESVKIRAAQEVIEARGLDINDIIDFNPLSRSNQIIISGTAYYDFHFFADYWKKWKQIIESKGDPQKISEIFNGDVPKGFDWRQYSIIRLPYELVPKGFMDEANIARSKASVHSGIFEMEYGACVDPSTQIITRDGLKLITDVSTEDYVLSHLGRWRKVTGKTNRFYSGEMLKISRYGMHSDELVTPDHLFYNGENFVEAIELENLTLPNLRDLNNNQEFLVDDYTCNFISREGYIYPESSRNKTSNKIINDILRLRDDGKSLYEIYKHLNLDYAQVKSILNQKRPKSAIHRNIKLDYNFGLCLGYYASEGSGGSNGKSISFSLDGHKDKSLEYFVDQLSNAIEITFGITPRKYSKRKNTVELTINSRIVFDLFKKICPGKCFDKIINSDILYSNSDLMKGFIVGFFNGDGHINDKNAIVGITGFNLLIQLRTVLSYFGITSSIHKKQAGTSTINGKIYKTRESYNLNLTGSNYRKFKSIFYGDDSSIKKDRNIMINDGNNSIYRIRQVESVPYSGLVYNLHVDEDESYCTLSSCSHNCFTKDSRGFFKRSLIESCVTSEFKKIGRDENIVFDAMTEGNPNYEYVMAIDPASEVDNFAIIIIELHETHRRVVYCWTVNKVVHNERLKAGLVQEDNYYSYCARKIRTLMSSFRIKQIMLDSQGGGVAVSEALHDRNALKTGELPIWPIIDPDKEKPSDDEQGLHLINFVNFASQEWTSEANHGMRKDLEDKILLFPKFDPIILALSVEQDREQNRLYDTLEDCVTEIEDLKNELVLIEVTTTQSGRERWDTPEIKISNKKGRMRKDRYSALLMANMGARSGFKERPDLGGFYGGFSKKSAADNKPQIDYIGPAWFTEGMKDAFGAY